MKRKTKALPQDRCEEFLPHREIVEFLSQKQIDQETIQKMAEIFKVMADYSRIRILHALSKKELCVCDLSELLQITPSAVSHQLRVLRIYDLVRYHKKGRSVFYRLADHHVLSLFQEALSHVLEKSKGSAGGKFDGKDFHHASLGELSSNLLKGRPKRC